MIRRPPRSTLFPTRRSSDLGGARPQTLVALSSEISTTSDPPSSATCPLPAHESTAPNLDRALVARSEEHTSELQSQSNLVCRLLLEKKKISNRFICRVS